MRRRLHLELTVLNSDRNDARGTEIAERLRLRQGLAQARQKLTGATIWEIHGAENAMGHIDVLLGQERRRGRPGIGLFRVGNAGRAVVDLAGRLVVVLAAAV